MDNKMALNVTEARKAIGGVSLQTFYNLVNSGELATFRIGRRRFVSEDAIRTFIRNREAEARLKSSTSAAAS